MLWPEGPAGIVTNIGSYLDPPLPNEDICAFSTSKASSYLAVASSHILALFRLKPLAPLAIYPELFPETEIKDIVASPKGDCLAVLTADNRISVFAVLPRHDIEEALRLTCIVTPGPGEAIGARELWLEPLSSVYTEHPTVSLGTLGPLLVVFSKGEVQVATWQSFEARNPLKPPVLVPHSISCLDAEENVISGVCGSVHSNPSDWMTCVVTDNGKAVLLLWVHAENSKTYHVEERMIIGGGKNESEGTNDEQVACIDYNIRMSKLALATKQGRIYLLNDVTNPDYKFFELLSDGLRSPTSLQWTPAGTALLVGYVDGWRLISMLGLDLFNYRDRNGDFPNTVAIVKAEWLVSAEIVMLLGSDGQIRVQQMLRCNNQVGSERNRPVLHGNGRLMLYHDPTPRHISGNDGSSNQSWLTVPLPTWYMAQNWPLTHICSSPDGRFVAVAGTIGIMVFSVASRQWKEIGDRESMVRGGLCWYGRRLVAATVSADDGTTSLKMFSSVGGPPSKPQQSTGLFGSQLGSQLGSQFLKSQTQYQTQNQNQNNYNQNQHQTNEFLSPQRSEHRLSAQDLLNEDSDIPPRSSQSNAGGSFFNSPNTATSPSSPLLTALPSTSSISGLGSTWQEQQVVAKDVLGRGQGSLVSLMVKGPLGLLGVLAGRDVQRLLIYDLGNLEFDLVKDVPLAGVLAGISPPPVVRAITLISESQVLVLADMTLLLVSSVDNDSRKYQRQVIAEPIESFEYLVSEAKLWVFDGQEAVVTSWSPTTPVSPTSERKQQYVASIPLDAYPVHYSPNRGVIALVEAEPVRSYDGSFTVARPTTTHEVYIPYVLEAALVPAYQSARDLAEKYCRLPYFAGVLESLLYRAVTNDDDFGETKLAIQLIKEFPNQNARAIVAGCARKVEMKYWERLFQAVGKEPSQLFDECLSNLDLETANEFLIVVQACSKEGTPAGNNDELPMLELDRRFVELYNLAFSNKQLWICKQLCEFILAVDPEGGLLKQFRRLIHA